MNYLIEEFDGIPIIIHSDIKALVTSESNDTYVLTEKKGGYKETSSSSEVSKKIASIKEVIFAITNSFNNKFEIFKNGPSEIELEFSLGFEKEVNFWVLGGKGTFNTTIKLIWKKDVK